MAIDPIQTAETIKTRFRQYLRTAFDFPEEYANLRLQFRQRLEEPGRLFRGPYLHGLAPYVLGASVADLVKRGLLPEKLKELPLVPADRPLYQHQVQAIERCISGRNVIVSSGTGSGKTLAFLAPILSSIIKNPEPGIHALLLYPMNALVNDQLKNLRRILQHTPSIRFGRYINSEVTPESQKSAERLYPDALPNEVISREIFRKNPPHVLITNYAMLEYLLLRADDSPLFNGPWRFVVVDEAHSYSGTKGGEVALLLRRLVARVKTADQKPPQYIATSASLGTSDPKRREDVLQFARDLFNAHFDSGDLIAAQREHASISGSITPQSTVYVHPAVKQATEPRAKWTPQLTSVLVASGFPIKLVDEAAKVGAVNIEEGLFLVFQHDKRIHLLRDIAEHPSDLATAAKAVIGSDTPEAIDQLCGIVRVATKAKVPDSDVRLAPCRYHLFVRGLSGASVSFESVTGNAVPMLHLDPTRKTDDGRLALELYACRKCGQPYLRGRIAEDVKGRMLLPGGWNTGSRWAWMTWAEPVQNSNDESDEVEEENTDFILCGWHITNGKYRELRQESPNPEEIKLWDLACEKDELDKCVCCGGKDSVTGIRADSDAAQAVLTSVFYCCLPESMNEDALCYPGRGRKLLTFADSRQSAAYFAPYLENNNDGNVYRWLVYQAFRRSASNGETDADSVIDRMVRIGNDAGLFKPDEPPGQKRKKCTLAAALEFCGRASRRESLEAIGLIACQVDLSKWAKPSALLKWLSEDDLTTTVQVLLSSFRQTLAMEFPDEITPEDPAFGFAKGQHAFIAQGSEKVAGRFTLHGWAPEVRPHLQKRAAYLKNVLFAASQRKGIPAPADDEITTLLDEIWKSLTTGAFPILSRSTLDKGTTGFRLHWNNLRLRSSVAWNKCSKCRQWSVNNVYDVCSSFRCTGHLIFTNPEDSLADHFYRTWFVSTERGPIPLVAREHTAQLGPQLATNHQTAFQDGHHPEVGQINVLSSSTTFELGVDLGDLEAVLLRNVPPSVVNYQQRAGRAGRGVGTAAMVVTFVQSRSHDEHHYSNPPLLIEAVARPPRVGLRNELIYQRHIAAVLLAEFVRNSASNGKVLSQIQHFFPNQQPTPTDTFLADLPKAISRNADTIHKLVPNGMFEPNRIAEKITESIRKAREYYSSEVESYREAIDALRNDELKARKEKQSQRAESISRQAYRLEGRLEGFEKTDWVSFFSDRVVLPSYAFPIYNVSLDTADRGLKLERDLRLALSEYVPGSEIVARGKLWRSIGIKKPRHKEFEEKWYAKCKVCSHVMRSLNPEEVFPGDFCPVCNEPISRRHLYRVPEYGFTTDLMQNGDDLSFDKPHRIRSSQVLFDPQKELEDPVRCKLGNASRSVTVRTTEQADFFVFNAGDDDRGVGFLLCKYCMREVKLKTSGRGKNAIKEVESHHTPYGQPCNGKNYDMVHLAHEFRSSATRLVFSGSGYDRNNLGFWYSLQFAILGGMTDALGIEANDINGVIRPLPAGGAQEVVIFDDVPGGAGHCLRLADEDELKRVLEAAHARVANCTCSESASCYACLRSYRNQFCHEQLTRGPVAEYLASFLSLYETDSVRPYDLPDAGNALRTAICNAVRLDLVVERFEYDGPPEFGPWHLPVVEAAFRSGHRVRIAIREWDTSSTVPPAHLLALAQAGVELFRVKPSAPMPPMALLSLDHPNQIGPKSVGFHWGDNRTTVFNSITHRQPLWHTRSSNQLNLAVSALDDWFASYAEPLPLEKLFRAQPGCKVHPIHKGEKVDFKKVLTRLEDQNITELVIQDPYLRKNHQINALLQFLTSIPWTRGQPVKVTIVTQIADISKGDQFNAIDQKKKIEACLNVVPSVTGNVDILSAYYSPIHMRYAYFSVTNGENLYVLERGLDIIDPISKAARSNSYILEFDNIPRELRSILLVNK
ncbi:MAG: DEAD/DEAH box helicase [Planctomycetia bacterium]|nr:DEAD/DEAH box helicase [Planctomycetia bacterium]